MMWQHAPAPIVSAMSARVPAAFLASLVLAAAGCGESKEDRAQSDVCAARASIQKSIDSLKVLTPSTATTDEIRQHLGAIRKDLGTMRSAQGDLNADRRNQVQAANAQFAETITAVAQTVLRSTSAEQAATEVKQGADKLQATYQSALSPIDCDS
jgi:Tfp pilus assembly protein PilP